MRPYSCFAALALVPSVAFAGQLLVNPGLELPLDAPSGSDLIDGWTLLEPSVDDVGAPVNSASFTSFANHTPGGDRGLWLRSFEGGLGGDEPATVDATLYQDVAAFAGVEYTLTAWFRYEANFTTGAVLLSIQFLDAGMGELSNATVDINSVNARDNVWREFSINAVAAPGTAFLRASVRMIDGVVAPANPQSGFVDDFSLVPAPGAGALLAMGMIIPRRRR